MAADIMLRKRAYLACLIVACLLGILQLAVGGWPVMALALGLPLTGALSYFLLMAARTTSPILTVCVLAASAVMLFLQPLGLPAVSADAPSPAGAGVWTAIAVCIFASRVLEEQCEQHLAHAWRDPRAGSFRNQSMLAALLLGFGLCLAWYQIASSLDIAADRADVASMILRAVRGDTVMHFIIILTFCIAVAALADTALQLVNENVALRRLQREGLRLDDIPEAYAHLRVADWLRAATSDASTESTGVARIHQASRRTIRTLISLLPLMGFLGTVIGLSVAMYGFVGDGPAGGVDAQNLGAAFAGLSVKFETTVLGIGGALIASLLLSLVERAEALTEANCLRLHRFRIAERAVA